MDNGEINVRCSKCNKDINADNEIYYVFIDKDITKGNEPYCVSCYLQDVQNMQKLYPFIDSPIYAKNFIRMNK